MTIEKTMTPGDLKLVTSKRLTDEQKKAWDAYYEPRNAEFLKADLKGKDLVRWKYNRYMHDYLGSVKSVDESVGRVLKYLDENGLAEDTIVVYSSDQGFYLGEHGWFDKRWIFEESVRTPLLVRWPGKVQAGSVNQNLVSVIDFAPTFLEAAGVPVPADIQGRSMVPVLTGETPADWRKSFYYHYYEYPAPHKVRRHYGVVTDRYKMVHFYAPDVNYWELYDNQKDPLELKNMLGQPGYESVEKELKLEVARLRKELKVPEDDNADYDSFVREQRLKRAASKKKAAKAAE
jgi:arylsulfatase A-like enzyme